MDEVLLQLERAILQDDLRSVSAILDTAPSIVNSRFPENLNLTPLMWACRNRRETIVADLLSRGADVYLTNRTGADGSGGNTALWFKGQGAADGTVEIAARLIAAGADVNTRCEQGQTALYIASAWGHLDLVQLLVKHGADDKLADENGQAPLDMLTADLAWCADQASLTPDQRRFQERAPAVAAFLKGLAGG